MRPVNLIPPEERRGAQAAARTGVFPYVIVAVLGLAVAAITFVTLTNNQISEREADKAALQVREDDATARANALAPFAEFASLSDARDTTVTSLAQSRFDWVRVMNELSLVLPEDVWLTNLSATVDAQPAPGDGADVPLGQGLEVPTLGIVGCATGHNAVAGFLEALKDIDGVTRVGVSTSEKGGDGADATGGSSSENSASCRTRKFISEFHIAVAFDAVVIAPTATAPEATTPAPGEVAPDAQVADAQAQEQQARDSTATQTDKAQNAVNIVPGVAK